MHDVIHVHVSQMHPHDRQMTTGNSPASGAPLMCVLRCVCVNVNTTDATAGATALLLPAQNSLSTIIIGTQTLQLANGRGAGLAASRGGVWRAGNGMLDEEAPCRAEPRNLST